MEKSHSASKIIIIAICAAAVTVGVTVSSFMLSRFMLRIQKTTEKSITVKGVAEKEITSDLGAFTASVSIKSANRPQGYATLDGAGKVLTAKLDSLGFTGDMRETAQISCVEIYRTEKNVINNREVSNQVFDHYKLTYSVRVRTGNVKLIASNALKLYELTARQMDVEISTPQYYISDPEQYKLELVDKASASAAERARVAAQQSGSRLGALMSARQGVIQITAVASNDTSDYGIYDTESIQKIIRLVMTMEFELK
jgi:hypothetical protein